MRSWQLHFVSIDMLLVLLLLCPLTAVSLSPPVSLQHCGLTPLTNYSVCCTSPANPFMELLSVQHMHRWLTTTSTTPYSVLQLYATDDDLSIEFQPIFLALARTFPQINFARIAADRGPGQPAVRLSGFHMARGFPSLYIFKRRTLLASYTGNRSLEDLCNFVHKYSEQLPAPVEFEIQELASILPKSLESDSTDCWYCFNRKPLAVWMWMWIWPTSTQYTHNPQSTGFTLNFQHAGTGFNSTAAGSLRDDFLNRVDPLFYVTAFFFVYHALHYLRKSTVYFL